MRRRLGPRTRKLSSVMGGSACSGLIWLEVRTAGGLFVCCNEPRKNFCVVGKILAASSLTIREMPRILWNRGVHDRVHISPLRCVISDFRHKLAENRTLLGNYCHLFQGFFSCDFALYSVIINDSCHSTVLVKYT
jgi:hypothetical protein